jgi:hypothetical protein
LLRNAVVGIGLVDILHFGASVVILIERRELRVVFLSTLFLVDFVSEVVLEV